MEEVRKIGSFVAMDDFVDSLVYEQGLTRVPDAWRTSSLGVIGPSRPGAFNSIRNGVLLASCSRAIRAVV